MEGFANSNAEREKLQKTTTSKNNKCWISVNHGRKATRYIQAWPLSQSPSFTTHPQASLPIPKLHYPSPSFTTHPHLHLGVNFFFWVALPNDPRWLPVPRQESPAWRLQALHGQRKNPFSNLKRMRTKRMRWIKWLSLYIPVIFPKNTKNSWLWPWVNLIVTYQYIRDQGMSRLRSPSCYQVDMWIGTSSGGEISWYDLGMSSSKLAFVNDLCWDLGCFKWYASSSPNFSYGWAWIIYITLNKKLRERSMHDHPHLSSPNPRITAGINMSSNMNNNLTILFWKSCSKQKIGTRGSTPQKKKHKDRDDVPYIHHFSKVFHLGLPPRSNELLWFPWKLAWPARQILQLCTRLESKAIDWGLPSLKLTANVRENRPPH